MSLKLEFFNVKDVRIFFEQELKWNILVRYTVKFDGCNLMAIGDVMYVRST